LARRPASFPLAFRDCRSVHGGLHIRQQFARRRKRRQHSRLPSAWDQSARCHDCDGTRHPPSSMRTRSNASVGSGRRLCLVVGPVTGSATTVGRALPNRRAMTIMTEAAAAMTIVAATAGCGVGSQLRASAHNAIAQTGMPRRDETRTPSVTFLPCSNASLALSIKTDATPGTGPASDRSSTRIPAYGSALALRR
jgi:hypothetical protein